MSLIKDENEHSPKYDKVKRYYDEENWKISRVRDAVVKGWITESEFEEITGKEY